MKQSNTMERLSILMEERNLKQVDIVNLVRPVAEKYNAKFNKSDISQYLSGKTEPNQNKLLILSEALNVNPAWLMGYSLEEDEQPGSEYKIKNIEDILEIKTKKIPLLGTIACGVPNLAEEYFEGYVEVGTDVKCDFALRCSGDSMINARIMDGDIVFIRKQPTVNDGEIAAVIIDGEATLKRVYFSDGFITLQAENPSIKPLIVPLVEDSQVEIRILGKAVAFQSDVK